MNDTIKIISVFDYFLMLRPKGLSPLQYESRYNWVYIVYDGKIAYSDDKNDLELVPFHLYVLPAGKTFYLNELPGYRLDHLCILINCSPAIRGFIDVDINDSPLLKDFASLLKKYVRRKNVSAITTVMEAVLSYVLTEFVHAGDLPRQIKTFIDNRSPMPSIEDVCKEFHYSRRYLDMQFKKAYGFTVDKYIGEKQFAYILEAVINKTLLDVICDKTGYSSPANLSRDFKKRFGVPPTYYRQYLNKQSSVPPPR